MVTDTLNANLSAGSYVTDKDNPTMGAIKMSSCATLNERVNSHNVIVASTVVVLKVILWSINI